MVCSIVGKGNHCVSLHAIYDCHLRVTTIVLLCANDVPHVGQIRRERRVGRCCFLFLQPPISPAEGDCRCRSGASTVRNRARWVRSSVWNAKRCRRSAFRLFDLTPTVGKAVNVTTASGREPVATRLSSHWAAVPRRDGKDSKVETLSRRALRIGKAHVASRCIGRKEASVCLAGNDGASVSCRAGSWIASVLAKRRLQANIVVTRTVEASNTIRASVSFALSTNGATSTRASEPGVGTVPVSSSTGPIGALTRRAVAVSSTRRSCWSIYGLGAFTGSERSSWWKKA